MKINTNTISTEKGRNLSIDIMRMIFAVNVFINHSSGLIHPNENVSAYMMFGFLGVEFFFILSGYLMAAKADKESDVEIGSATIRFIYKKVCSYYPYFIIAWIMGMAVDGIGKDVKTIVTNILKSFPILFQINMAGFRGYQVLGPTWYLSAMILTMLILYPLLLRFRKDFNLAIAPIIGIFSYGYLFLKVGNLATIEPLDNGFIYTGLIRGVGGISLGCICYECAKTLSQQSPNKRAGSVLAFLELLAFGLAILLQRTRTNFRPDFLFVCLAAIGITAAFCKQNALCHALHGNYSWIGRFSLSFYLADAVARSLILHYMPNATREQRLAPVIVLVILLAVMIQVLGNFVKQLAGEISKRIKIRYFT